MESVLRVLPIRPPSGRQNWDHGFVDESDAAEERSRRRERLRCALSEQWTKTARQIRWQGGVAIVLAVIVTMGIFYAIPYQFRFAWLLWPPCILVISVAFQHHAGRRLRAASRVLLLVGDDDCNDWRAIDGTSQPPSSLGDALSRLGDRSDDLATSLRLGWRSLWEETGRDETAGVEADDLAGDLERWQPTDPVYVARRSRIASRLAYLDGIDDLEHARAAAEAINEPDRRVRELARLALDEARRRAFEGLDGLEPLVRIRSEVKRAKPVQLSPTQRDARVRARLRFAALMVILVGVGGFMAVTEPGPAAPYSLGNYVSSWGGSGLLNPNSSRAAAFTIIEDAAIRAQVLSGPLGADDIVSTIEASTPVEMICLHEGVAVQSTGIPGGQIRCIAVLVGEYQRGGPEQALVSTEPASQASVKVYLGGTAKLSYTGVFPTTAYLVSLPRGTMAQLLNVIHPSIP